MNDIVEIPRTQTDLSTVATLTKSEINQQIATAHEYPRSVTKFLQVAQQMATLNEDVAAECTYQLPRAGSTIEGPSARFAEILLSSWGNARAGARVVDEGQEFVTAQGVFHDLESNSAVSFEVQRRIVDKNGRRFNADMIGMTANAACSIALRNAILKGIPKAFWSNIHRESRKTAMGSTKTLEVRRKAAMEAFRGLKVKDSEVFAFLEVKGIQDITIEHMFTLHSVLTAIQDGDTTVSQVFERKVAKAPDPKTRTRTKPKTQEKPAESKVVEGEVIETKADPTPDPEPEPEPEPEPKTEEMPDIPAAFDRRGKGREIELIDDVDKYTSDMDEMMSGAKDQDTLNECWIQYEGDEDRIFPADQDKVRDAMSEIFDKHKARLKGDG